MSSVPKKTASQSKTSASVNVVNSKENILKGTFFSLGSIVVGIVLWVMLWRMGFIASIAAFAVAWVAVWLYGLGAGTVTRKSAPIIVAVSVVGVMLSFFAAMVSDALDFFHQEVRMPYLELLTSSDFWSVFWANLQTAELWSSYRNDILISLLFAGLGMFWTLKDLFVIPTNVADSKKAA